MENGDGVELSILEERLLGYDAGFKTGRLAGILSSALVIFFSFVIFQIVKHWFGFTITF